MTPNHRNGRITIWTAIMAAVVAILAIVLIVAVVRYVYKPVALRGAIIQQNEDPKKQSPITDVEITALDNFSIAAAKSDFSGYFKLILKPGVKRGQVITLQFRHSDYQSVEMKEGVGDKLYIVSMVPLLHDDAETSPTRPQAPVANVFVRYSIETTAAVNIGTGVPTFQIVNKGNVRCNHGPQCSPDNKWKAAIGGATLDAGQGNVYDNARVSCIAGPCPFTKIETDNFTRGGRNIGVTVLGWSDTTTFLFQAEVFRQQINDIVRESYPVIFGRALNFTLPAAAEGPSLEAELSGTNIVFPLGPAPNLSWASCNVKVEKAQ